jgi:hypothetical protein
VTRQYVPGLWIKPQMAITTTPDTNTVYSAILFAPGK